MGALLLPSAVVVYACSMRCHSAVATGETTGGAGLDGVLRVIAAAAMPASKMFESSTDSTSVLQNNGKQGATVLNCHSTHKCRSDKEKGSWPPQCCWDSQGLHDVKARAVLDVWAWITRKVREY